jgi:hypothetical protein
VFEVVDGELFAPASRAPLGEGALLAAVEGIGDTLPGVAAP